MPPEANSTPQAAGRSSTLKLNSKFPCVACAKWKPIEAFTKAERGKLQNAVAKGLPVNAPENRMMCMECNESIGGSIQCSACFLRRPRSFFSKRSIKDEEPRCMQCVAWDETQEPDVTPFVPPNFTPSPEESAGQMWRDIYSGKNTVYNPDNKPITSTANSEAGEVASVVGRSEAGSMGLRSASRVASVNGDAAPDSHTSEMPLPPHIASKLSQRSAVTRSAAPSESGKTASTANAKSQKTNEDPLPPHLRPHLLSLVHRSKGSSTTQSEAACQSVSTATTMRENQKPMVVPNKSHFNAYDPTGQRRDAFKSHTVVSSSISTISRSVSQSSWGDGHQRNGNITLLDTDSVTTGASSPGTPQGAKAKRNGWHKPNRLSRYELVEHYDEPEPRFDVTGIKAKVDQQMVVCGKRALGEDADEFGHDDE